LSPAQNLVLWLHHNDLNPLFSRNLKARLEIYSSASDRKQVRF